MNNVSRLAGLLASFTLLGCDMGRLAGGAGAGNPPQADVVLSFKANSASPAAKRGGLGLSKSSHRNPDSTFTVLDSSGASLTLTAIEVLVLRIDIDLPKGVTCAEIHGLACKDSVASVKGPYTMDLMSGSATPFINFIKLPEGLYTTLGLEVPIPLLGPDSLGNNGSPHQNIVIRGKTEVGGQAGKTFEIKLSLDDGLDFEDSLGFRIESASLNNLILKLNVDGWFTGTGFSRCLEQSSALTDSAGTTILQGDGFCDGLGFRIRKNVEASGEIENDEQDQVQ